MKNDNDSKSIQHFIEVDTLKGFGMFLVIAGHAIIVYPVNLPHIHLWCDFLRKFIYMFHMPLFFVISGFCFSFYRNYTLYLERKIQRLLVPYIAFNLIDLLPRTLLTSLVNRPNSISQQLAEIVFYGGEFWFLYELFLIFLLFPLIAFFYEKKEMNCDYDKGNNCNGLVKLFLNFSILKNWNIIVITTIISFIALSGIINCRLFRLSSFFYHLFYFNIGYLIKLYYGQLSLFLKYITKVRAFILSVFLIIVSTFYIMFAYGTKTILFALIGCLFSWLLTYSDLFNKIFNEFGIYSLQLYLLNGLTLGVSRYITCIFFKIENPFVIIGFNVMVDFFLSYYFIKWVLRYRCARKIMGFLSY